MIELGRDLRLARKPRQRLAIGHATQHLQRQPLPDADPLDLVHRAHPARAELLYYTITIFDQRSRVEWLRDRRQTRDRIRELLRAIRDLPAQLRVHHLQLADALADQTDSE